MSILLQGCAVILPRGTCRPPAPPALFVAPPPPPPPPAPAERRLIPAGGGNGRMRGNDDNAAPPFFFQQAKSDCGLSPPPLPIQREDGRHDRRTKQGWESDFELHAGVSSTISDTSSINPSRTSSTGQDLKQRPQDTQPVRSGSYSVRRRRTDN